MGERVLVQNVHCINQATNLYRADINNKDTRLGVSKNARKLKDSGKFSRVYINRDLTYPQRQNARSQRMEARTTSANSIPIGSGDTGLAPTARATAAMDQCPPQAPTGAVGGF